MGDGGKGDPVWGSVSFLARLVYRYTGQFFTFYWDMRSEWSCHKSAPSMRQRGTVGKVLLRPQPPIPILPHFSTVLGEEEKSPE